MRKARYTKSASTFSVQRANCLDTFNNSTIKYNLKQLNIQRKDGSKTEPSFFVVRKGGGTHETFY